MKPNTGKILIIQGAQYGSEGKGQVAALVAKDEGATYAVRTGSINAGHTVWYEHRDKGLMPFSMQQIPTAWVIPGVTLVIGAGAFIHQGILEREIAMISEATGEDIRKRLYIDYRCTLHSLSAEASAKMADRHHKMGATGKGSSEALKQKLDARGDFDMARALSFSRNCTDHKIRFTDTSELLNNAYDHGATILLEGTQGSLLDLNLAQHPFVTNRGCNAATWLAEAGLSPSLNVETILVARTFPIRVAGNSGYMGEETTWEDMWRNWNEAMTAAKLQPLVPTEAINLYERIKDIQFGARMEREHHQDQCLEFWDASMRRYAFQPHKWTDDQKEHFSAILADIPSTALTLMMEEYPFRYDEVSPYIEKTTVTRKPRRIAKFDHDEFAKAIMWNRPSRVFMGFANYVDPTLWGTTGADIDKIMSSPSFGNFLDNIEPRHGIKICGTSTGAKPENHIFW